MQQQYQTETVIQHLLYGSCVASQLSVLLPFH